MYKRSMRGKHDFLKRYTNLPTFIRLRKKKKRDHLIKSELKKEITTDNTEIQGIIRNYY
jgi:hypothetical protein